MKKLARQLFDQLNKKKALPVDEDQLRTIAGQVKPKELADDAKLKELIRTLSKVTSTSVSPEKEERLIRMIRDGQQNPDGLKSLLKRFPT